MSSDRRVQEYVQEAQRRASYQDTLECISGCSSKPQKVTNHRLGFVREHILPDWYQLERNSVWAEQKVFDKLNILKLAPEQQSSVDSGIYIEQWALRRLMLQKPFNDLRRRLIYSLNPSCQASTILMDNADQVADYCHKFDQALTNKAQGAFLPIRERDLFLLDPQPTVLGELDPSYQGPIFPDSSSLEEPDLESIMGDSVPEDIKTRVLIAARKSYTRNQKKVQTLNSKSSSLYTVASGLVNDGEETLRGLARCRLL